MPSSQPRSKASPRALERRVPRARWAFAAAFLGAGAGALAWGAGELFPREDAVARGVRLGGVAVAPGQDAFTAAEAAARRALDRRVTLTWAVETLLEATVAE